METTPFPNKTTFGPGWLESVTLTSWVTRHGTRWVRARGSILDVDEAGYTVTVEFDERAPIVDCIIADLDGCLAPDCVAGTLYGFAIEAIEVER